MKTKLTSPYTVYGKLIHGIKSTQFNKDLAISIANSGNYYGTVRVLLILPHEREYFKNLKDVRLISGKKKALEYERGWMEAVYYSHGVITTLHHEVFGPYGQTPTEILKKQYSVIKKLSKAYVNGKPEKAMTGLRDIERSLITELVERAKQHG